MLKRKGNERLWRSLMTAVLGIIVVMSVVTVMPARAQDGGDWSPLPGNVLDIAINDAAQAYAVSQTGEALRWRAGDQRWSRMSGKFVRITGAEGNRPWGVTDDGVVMRFNGLWWEPKGNGVADVAGDALGNVVIARRDGTVQRWEPLSSSWRDLEQQVPARRIALDERGSPWAVTRDGRIFRLADGGWQPLPGVARDVAVGGNGTAVIADREGNVRSWDPSQQSWLLVPGVTDIVAVAATPKGAPWAATGEGKVLAAVLIKKEDVLADVPDEAPTPQASTVQAPGIKANSIVAPGIQAGSSSAPQSQAQSNQAQQAQASQPQTSSPAGATGEGTESASGGSGSESPGGGSGGVDPAATTTSENIVFTDTRETASRVEIGKDGSVFVLAAGGAIKRWSNERNRLEDFPGQLARLAVDNAGNPWGVTSLGRVFRHDGRNWKQVSGATASDIAIGGDGTVITADADSLLARYNPETNRFERLQGRGIQVAVAPDGTPWTIREDNVVQRCDTATCIPVNRLARNLSIGPDGSLFIVTTQNQLQRRRVGSGTFERILLPGHTPDDVAAGPNGFPWVTTTAGKLLASKFFERDESADRTLALRTTQDTSGTGATAAVVSSQSSSGFQFTKNMRFDSFESGFGSLDNVFVGRDDTVFISDLATVLEFNERTEAFEAMDTTFPASVNSVSSDADGVIWGLDNANATAYRIKGTQVKTYTITSGPGSSPRNLAVTGDGDVYAAIGASIWLKEADKSMFREQTEFGDDNVFYVAIAGAGDIWIVNQSFEVQQWTGSKFEDRPKGRAQDASRIAAGADGTVYVVNNGSILRWNATNGDFDEVNATNISTDFDKVAVTSAGRPWAANTSSGGEDIFRARE